MSAPIFDRALIAQRRKRANQNFKSHDFLFEWAEEQMLDRLDDFTRAYETALRIGTRGSQFFSHALSMHPRIGDVFTMDLTGALSPDLIADEEFLPFQDASLDMVISPLSLHTVNDLPGTLIQIRRALKPDGLFLAAMLGGETLYELRDCLTQAEMAVSGGMSPRISPFADKQQMGGLMQRAGFALPVIDSDIITVTYSDFYKLLHDIRGMGESNVIIARSKRFTPKALFEKAAEIYAQKYSKEGKLVASFEVIFLTGWAPDASQQKPLKPGSAENSLAEFLGTKEIGAGEEV